jgi:hypothetical protein
MQEGNYLTQMHMYFHIPASREAWFQGVEYFQMVRTVVRQVGVERCKGGVLA